jgi:hypothetical protein
MMKTTQSISGKGKGQVVLETSMAMVILVVLLIGATKTMLFFVRQIARQQQGWNSTRVIEGSGDTISPGDVQNVVIPPRDQNWLVN